MECHPRPVDGWPSDPGEDVAGIDRQLQKRRKACEDFRRPCTAAR